MVFSVWHDAVCFLVEVKIRQRKTILDPVRGEEMTVMLQRAFSAPPEVIAAARETMGGR